MQDPPRLAEIWGHSEASFSGVLGQALCFSPTFRKVFFGLLDQAIRCPEACRVKGEAWLSGDSRIDLLVETDDGLELGIENKLWARLQPSQLHRYARLLQERSEHHLLVFVTPSRYRLDDMELPKSDRFRRISYRQLVDALDLPGPSSAPPFEEHYLGAMRELFQSIEDQPLSLNDMAALGAYTAYRKAEHKLQALLHPLGVKVETSSGNYVLAAFETDVLPIYAGFRFGCDWYFSDPLLNGTPECLVYVKKVGGAPEAGRLISALSDRGPAKQQAPWSPDDTVELGDGGSPVLLVVRRPLTDFLDRPPELATQWLDDARKGLRAILEAAPPAAVRSP